MGKSAIIATLWIQMSGPRFLHQGTFRTSEALPQTYPEQVGLAPAEICVRLIFVLGYSEASLQLQQIFEEKREMDNQLSSIKPFLGFLGLIEKLISPQFLLQYIMCVG